MNGEQMFLSGLEKKSLTIFFFAKSKKQTYLSIMFGVNLGIRTRSHAPASYFCLSLSFLLSLSLFLSLTHSIHINLSFLR